MLRRRLIPSLLLRKGRLVKGVRFAAHRDAGHPVGTARAHNAQGADEIVILDIDAAREGRGPDLEMLKAVAAVSFIPLTIGGGITSADIGKAGIAGGADKVMVTATALNRPALVGELARALGVQAVVVGIDVMREDGRVLLYDHLTGSTAGTGEWVEWLRRAVGEGAGEIRLMSVDREGVRKGFDLALYEEAARHVSVPIILEGGAGSLAHLDDAFKAGVEAVGLGTMLVFSDNNIFKLKQYLDRRGHQVRRLEGA